MDWEKNGIEITGHNTPAAEQCGRFPDASIHRTCKQWLVRKDTTSKTRTAAAGQALAAILTTFLSTFILLLVSKRTY